LRQLREIHCQEILYLRARLHSSCSNSARDFPGVEKPEEDLDPLLKGESTCSIVFEGRDSLLTPKASKVSGHLHLSAAIMSFQNIKGIAC